MPTVLVILGAGGDLTSRYLVPGLVELHTLGRLPEGLRVVAVGRHDRSDDDYRDSLREVACEEGCTPAEADEVISRVEWAEADATDRSDLAGLPIADDDEVVAHLALPPSVITEAIGAVAAAPWGARARVAVEKPFGTHLSHARELNAMLSERFEPDQVFRVDHFLGLGAIRRLRHVLARPAMTALWRSPVVRSIEVVWDETLALEGRAGYYDDTGALLDMVQNHLLQVLAVAVGAGDRFHALGSLSADPDSSVRARYAEGTIDGHRVPAYVGEEGVDPERGTETFASVQLQSDDVRWRDVAFTLRSGKALATDRRALRVELDGGDTSVLDLGSGTLRADLGDVILTAPPPPTPGPYAQVLDDLFAGDHEWFVTGPEAEAQWRIVEPVLAAWRAGAPPLGEYPAGAAEVTGPH